MSGTSRAIRSKSEQIINVYLRRIMAILIVTLTLLVVNIDVLREIMANNQTLSVVIVLAFLLGNFLCYRNFYRLKHDFTVLCDMDEILSERRDMTVFRQYQGKTYFTSELYQRLEENIEFDDTGAMVKGLKPAMARSLIDIVKNAVAERRTLMSYFSSLLIYLGLLGTFIGLFATVGSITGLIGVLAAGLSGEQDLAKMLVMLIQQLEEPLSGMGVAFGTSLAGLCGSIVISALAMNINRASALFAKIYSDWLVEFAISGGEQQRQGSTGNAVGTDPGAPADVLASANPLDNRLQQLAEIAERQLTLMESMATDHRERSEALQQLLRKQHEEFLLISMQAQSRGEQHIQLCQRMVDELAGQGEQLNRQMEGQNAYQNQTIRMREEWLDLQQQVNEQGRQGNNTLVAIFDRMLQLPDSIESVTAEQMEHSLQELEQSLSQRLTGFLQRYIRRLGRLGRQDKRQQVDNLVSTIQGSEQRIVQKNEQQIKEQSKSIQKKQTTLILKLFLSIHRLYRLMIRRGK